MNIKIKKKISILLTVFPNSSQSSNDAVDSDSAVEFDQKLSAALRTLGTRVIGEIAFQLDRGILETMFQPGTSLSNGQSKKTRYGYNSRKKNRVIANAMSSC